MTVRALCVVPFVVHDFSLPESNASTAEYRNFRGLKGVVEALGLVGEHLGSLSVLNLV